MTSTRAGNAANESHSPNSVRSDFADHALIPNRNVGRRTPQAPPALMNIQTTQPLTGSGKWSRTNGAHRRASRSPHVPIGKLPGTTQPAHRGKYASLASE